MQNGVPLVSLYSIEITRYHSWFLEYKLTRLNSIPARVSMVESLFTILFLLHYHANIYEGIPVTNTRRKGCIWSINLGPGGICTSFRWVHIDRTVHYSWLALPNPLSGGCVRANYITYTSYLDSFVWYDWAATSFNGEVLPAYTET